MPALKLTYKPEGVEPRTWTIDPERDIRASEYIAVQKVSGVRGVEALMEGIAATDMLAIKALLWLLLKRDMSTLSWDSLDFTLGEIEFDSDEDPGELRRRLEAMEAQGTLSEAGRRALDSLILQGIDAAVLPEDVPAGPKA
jgi:hypothetical protein